MRRQIKKIYIEILPDRIDMDGLELKMIKEDPTQHIFTIQYNKSRAIAVFPVIDLYQLT